MPLLVIPETYADGQVLFEADLDHIKTAVEDFFNLTKIDSANFQSSIVGQLIPTGTVVMYGSGTPPPGWLNCDGALVSRFAFAVLFGVIGETFGAGDNSTTFNLPNFARHIPIGQGGSQISGPSISIGDQGGSETHSLTIPEMPSHTHVSGATHTHFETTGSSGSGTAPGSGPDGGTPFALFSNTATAISTLDSIGSGTAHNNVQPSLVVNFIIKT